jgi:hypothetical protein
MSVVSCFKHNADVADLQSQVDALKAAAVPAATTTLAGKAELATAVETGAGTDPDRVITPESLTGALNSGATSGGNAAQKAVVNAVEQAIGTDAGAQAAIAAAIADDILGGAAFAAALAAAAPNLKTCANTDMPAGAQVPTCLEMNAAISAAVAAVPGDKYLQGLAGYNATTNVMTLLMSDGSTVSVDMTALVNDAAAAAVAPSDASIVNSVEAAIGADPGAQLTIANAIADDLTGKVGKVTAGSNITVTGTGTAVDPFVVSAASGISLTNTAPSTSSTTAATPAFVNAAIAAAETPTATDTVAGKVSLAVAANMPSTSDTEAATPAAVNAAIAANNTAMGATAAETIAGTEAVKFISPDDLKAALQAGAIYPISIRTSSLNVPAVQGTVNVGGTNAVLGNVPVGINGGSANAANGVYGRHVDPGTEGAGVYGAKVSPAGDVYQGALGYQQGAIVTSVFGRNEAVIAGTWAGYFVGNVNVTGTVTQGSDSRIKRDVQTIDAAKALEFRNGLRWVTFEKFFTTQDADGKDFTYATGYEAGLIAQEVQALTKKIGAFEFVVKDSNPDMLALDYTSINAIVMAAEQAVLMQA